MAPIEPTTHGEGGKQKEAFCPLQIKGCERIHKQEKKMDKLETAIQESRDANGRIEHQLEHGNKEFAELNQYIKGNGQPGMIERLTRVETKYTMLWMLCAGAVLAAVGALVANLIKG
jgi:hypothetical protein